MILFFKEPEKLDTMAWRIRKDVVINIQLPQNLLKKDVEKLKALLDNELKFNNTNR